MIHRFRQYLSQEVSNAPLVVFRVLFGGVMLLSVLRFISKGWVTELYVEPRYFFTYYGFEWVRPLGETGMYLAFWGMALAAVGMMLGWWYRLSSLAFFVLFTYVELLDKTNYLNHYYFVSVMALLLCVLPAHRRFSLDALWQPQMRQSLTPRWTIGAVRLQLGMVYFFAGLAKIHPDWLLRAMPLKLWLPAQSHLPVVGGLLKWKATAYVFSWFGMLYDLTIPFFLCMRRFRWWAYAAVIAFHLMTWWLFPIGMFPFIMILSTLVFFPASFHEKIIQVWDEKVTRPLLGNRAGKSEASAAGGWSKVLLGLMVLHFAVQAALPFRYLLYPGELFWTEQGYRFSWRVMLMEKAGYASFTIRDPRTGREGVVRNSDYLTPNQEKMMATQPDMILQFAHFLAKEYGSKGIAGAEVYADVYVSLNGTGSRPFVDSRVNLAAEREGFHHKTWVLPYEAALPSTHQGDLSTR